MLKHQAVVIGLCSHGLAVVRSLARHGVPVIALESNPRLPGSRTALAERIFVSDINSADLIDSLVQLAQTRSFSSPPVLMLTNDNMVRIVAEHWPRLSGHYLLSWSGAREDVARLLNKENLDAICRQRGLGYPRTFTVASQSELSAVIPRLRFPCIVKPKLPLRRFKVRRPDSELALWTLYEEYASELPWLLQDWIAGDDCRLFFGALYLDCGRSLAQFCGQKLRSEPFALGPTTVAAPCVDEEVVAAAIRFFEHTQISGPVSLEVKKDRQGHCWVIEPTVGRTDFWLKVCVDNGVDLPWIEYQHQIGVPIKPAVQLLQAIWYDVERDPSALIEEYWRQARARSLWRISFPYLDYRDLKPSLASMAQLSQRCCRFLGRRLRQLVSVPQSGA